MRTFAVFLDPTMVQNVAARTTHAKRATSPELRHGRVDPAVVGDSGGFHLVGATQRVNFMKALLVRVGTVL
jgi:hypothetical protein